MTTPDTKAESLTEPPWLTAAREYDFHSAGDYSNVLAVIYQWGERGIIVTNRSVYEVRPDDVATYRIAEVHRQ